MRLIAQTGRSRRSGKSWESTGERAMSEQKEQKRRRFTLGSFSLRTLLVAITAIALLLHFWIIPSERQRRFCEKVKGNGGCYSFYGDETLFGNKTPPWHQHYTN